jgi:hypothetical protein
MSSTERGFIAAALRVIAGLNVKSGPLAAATPPLLIPPRPALLLLSVPQLPLQPRGCDDAP